MPLYDYSCSCGHEWEVVVHCNEQNVKCPVCGGAGQRMVSVPKVSTCNQDSPWIRQLARSVIDPDTADRKERYLRNNPTRDAVLKYVDSKGLIVSSPRDNVKFKKPKTDHDAVAKKLLQKHKERTAITINS